MALGYLSVEDFKQRYRNWARQNVRVEFVVVDKNERFKTLGTHVIQIWFISEYVNIQTKE